MLTLADLDRLIAQYEQALAAPPARYASEGWVATTRERLDHLLAQRDQHTTRQHATAA
jgi:hypothetical protein